MEKLILKPGREKSVKRHHPWIFSGAIAQITGAPEPGSVLGVFSSRGEALGLAAWSPSSQLTGRFWSFDPEESIDAAFFRRRLAGAVAYRKALGLPEKGGGCRLVSSEADGLPGLIVDVYDEWLVVQFLAAGMEYFRDTVLRELQALWPARGIYERSDVDVRRRENLPEAKGVIAGGEPPELIPICEHGLQFLVDVTHGHKTGFYFDQRDNRRAVAAGTAGGEVLNLFSYTGGFGVAALAAGAGHVVNVDSSAPALRLAVRNMETNGVAPERYENMQADAFEALRRLRREGRKFDAVVLDPPKFVDSAGALMRGCRAYKDIALSSFLLLKPGGTLFTFSCSGLLTAELFQKITADAALDAGVEAAIVGRLEQAPDHPTPLAFPEAFYLKGLEVKVR